MDASQYKDYVLTLLFVKYVSDEYAGKPNPMIEVPERGGFEDMVALRGDKEIGEEMNKIIGRLAEANDLAGVINIADFNDEDKLGSGLEMQKRLSNLVGIFANLDLSANRAEGDDLLGDAYEYLMRHSKVAVALPPLPEQRAIADALSDVDALISALDRFIAKKRSVKTAAMQRLLTGKHRLPGFDGEWEVKRLGDVYQIISGGTPSTSVPAFWDGGIEWCTPTDITANNDKYLFKTTRTISDEGLKRSSAALLPRGTLLLCTRATIGEIKIAAVPVSTNQGFKSLICGRDADNEFLYYKMLTLKNELMGKGVGSTFLEVSRKDIASLEIPLPAIEEQRAIATVLSDMDAEISAIEGRREKTREVKWAMMGELLTGRVRLV